MKLGSMLLVMLMAAGASVEAQSLGDMAQKEKEKREARAKEAAAKTAKPGDKAGEAKVYTVDDLAGYAEKEAPAPAGDEAEGGQAALPAPSEGGDQPLVKRPAEEPQRTESEEAAARAQQERKWRQRAQAARSAVAAAEQNLAAAEKAKADIGIGPQTNDEEQRRQFADQVRAADQQLTRAQRAVTKSKADLNNLEEEARRAGALPGWLR